MEKEDFERELKTNLARRQELSRASIQKLYSRKTVEQGFLEVFELVGGVPRLALWANEPENFGEFLKLLMKFAPKEFDEKVTGNVTYISNVPASPLNRPKPDEPEQSD